MLYNLHTHTTRCNHASGSDREYVEAAIKAGIKVLGFSDHCPQFFPKVGYYSIFRMFPEQTAEYFESVNALKKEYAADITILSGFEAEYYPLTFRRFMEFILPFEPDYLILGQHFVGNECDSDSVYSAVENNSEKLLRQYVDQVIEGIRTNAFTYIAHPDILNYNGSEDFYRSQMERLCAEAKRLDIPLEYNILGRTNNKNYPDARFWKIASQIGNKTVLGFDAHSPSSLLQQDVYCECRKILADLGLPPLDFKELTLRNPKEAHI